MERRDFIKQGIGVGLLSGIIDWPFDSYGIADDNIRTIVIRTSWSNVDIGELANIQAAQNVVQRGLPRARIFLWPAQINDAFIKEMSSNYSSLLVLDGMLNTSLEPDNEELQEALSSCDLFIWMGGVMDEKARNLSFVDNLDDFTRVLSYCMDNRIMYGIYGTVFNQLSEQILVSIRPILDQSAFIFTMDSESLDYLKELKIKCKKISQGTNLNFGYTFSSEWMATELLTSMELTGKDYFGLTTKTYLPFLDDEVKKSCCDKIVNVIREFVNQHEIAVLIIPSNQSEIESSKKYILEPLKNELGDYVHTIDKVLAPNLASPIIDRCRFMISMDLNTLILGYRERTPGLFFYLPEFGNEVVLIDDLGIKDWKLNIIETTEEDLINALTQIHEKYVKALVDVDQISKHVNKGQDEFIQYAGKLLYQTREGESEKKKKAKKKKSD